MNESAREILKEFIRTWELCPEIWNNSCDAYRDKFKKNKALDKLLVVYSKIKPESTRHDIRKKINTLRTNFRREWIKVKKSKYCGGEEYVPTSWLYYELEFLAKDFEEPDFELEAGQQIQNTNEKYKEENEWDDNDMEEVEECSVTSMDPLTTSPQIKRKKLATNPQQHSTDYLIQSTSYQIDNEPDGNQEEDHVVKIWARKLKKLDPIQKLYAEKAINDILFEAELQNLQNKKDL